MTFVADTVEMWARDVAVPQFWAQFDAFPRKAQQEGGTPSFRQWIVATTATAALAVSKPLSAMESMLQFVMREAGCHGSSGRTPTAADLFQQQARVAAPQVCPAALHFRVPFVKSSCVCSILTT